MTLEQALALIARLDAQNKALQASVADLNQRIAVLLERLGERPPDPPPPKGGKPRSKDSDPAPPPSQKRPKKDRTGLKRHNHGRTRSSAKLARAEQVIPAPKACPHCQGCDVRNHDTEVTEEYDYVRGYLRVRRTVALGRSLRRLPRPGHRPAAAHALRPGELHQRLERVVPHPDNRGLTAAMLTPQAYKAGLKQERAARQAA